MSKLNFDKIGLVFSAWLFALISTVSGAAQTPKLWGDLSSGNSRIGFKLLNLSDNSRTFVGMDAKTGKLKIVPRPVSMSVWYPAKVSGKQPPMPFAEYVDAYVSSDAELYKGLTESDKVRVRNLYREKNFKTDALNKFNELLHTKTAVFKDATFERGTFPVVLYAPGAGGTPLTHTVTCEFLASYGFVVVSASSRGVNSFGMTLDEAGVEAQTRDLEFMLAALADFPNADANKIGAVGFSLGAGAALTLAMRNPLVKAVASLDGSIGFAPYIETHRNLQGFETAKMRVPLLFVNSSDYEYNDSSILDSLEYSDRYLLSFKKIEHHDLIASKNISGLVRGTTDQRAKAVYQLTCAYLLNFLNAELKDGKTAKDFLAAGLKNPEEFSGLAALQKFAALPQPPTEEELIALIRQPNGIEQAREIYQKAAKQNAEAHFWREAALENIGLDLLDENRVVEAIEIFKLNAAAFPKSERALNALAEAYSQSGDGKTAREIYQKVLILNPRSIQAIRELKKLGEGEK